MTTPSPVRRFQSLEKCLCKSQQRTGCARNYVSWTLLWLKDTLPVVQRPMAWWKTSSRDQQSHSPGGTGCVPTTKLTLPLSQPGTQIRPSWIAVTVGLPNSPVSLLRHLNRAAFLRKHCEDGRSQQERPLLSAIKQRASIGASLRYNRVCKPSWRL